MIQKNPLVHSGNEPRAEVLAYLVGTLQLPVDAEKVHPLLYKTTNMQAAEKRAAEAVHYKSDKSPPPSPPEGIKKLAEHVLGTYTVVAFLPLPADAALCDAAAPFRYDDDANGVHLAVLWKRDDTRAQIEDVCALRVTGIKQQVERANRVHRELVFLKDADIVDTRKPRA